VESTHANETWLPGKLDLRIAVCVLVCCLVSTALSALNLKFAVGEMRLEIIQKMTACISCLLCCQDGVEASRKAGLTRVIVTAIGGIVGMGVVAIDQLLGSNPWVLVLLVSLGLVIAMSLCRLARVPAFSARIGGITFLLVACTLTGTARLWYALFRLISTVFGAIVVWIVTALMSTTKGR